MFKSGCFHSVLEYLPLKTEVVDSIRSQNVYQTEITIKIAFFRTF